MNKILLFAYFSCACIATNAQEVVSSQGESYTNAAANVDFTIGEVITATYSNASNDLTQGFHQTNWKFLELVDNNPLFIVTVYPNPTSEWLTVKAPEFENVVCTFYDGNGKVVSQELLVNEQTLIEVNQWAAGSYSLVLSKTDVSLKTIKLIKTL
ncbi:MAG: T9SS type A sorting domain-containing protein [Fluviicola sp.]|nr:T9SS type A sorting domain-containing protein [Fluviicola sp.]